MATMIDIEDVVDSGGFAELLQVKRRTVLNYLNRQRKADWPNEGARGAFPRPLQMVGVSPVWARKDAEDYARNRPGPGWHQTGDERIAHYIRTHPDAGADRTPAQGVGADLSALQSQAVDADTDGG